MKNKFGILAGITFIISLLSLPVKSDEIKLGIILGYTGPIESLTEDMARGAEMAIAEVNNSSRFMGGKNTLINTDGHNYKGNSKDTSAGRDNHKSYFSNLSNTMQLVKKARIHVD